MRAQICALMAVAAGLLMPSTASAQTNHVAWSYVESESWRYHPIYTVDSLGAITISNFVAIMDGTTATGNNLVAVWYRRDAGTGTWDAWSWDTTDPWAAINHVKSILVISDDENDRWKTPGDGLGITPIAAEGFAYGVLAADDLADDILIDADPDAMIAMLVAGGYRAASLTLQHTDGCKIDDKLDGMAVAFRETLFEPWSTAVDRMMTKWIESGSSGCDLGDDGIAIVDFPIQLLPPSPAEYACHDLWDLPEYPDYWITRCRVLEWTWTNVVTQKRTRSRFNPTPPPTYEFCDQTRTGLLTSTVSCKACVSYTEFELDPPVPPSCPEIAPGVKPPVGSGCSSWPFGVPTISTAPVTWSAWTPACPF